MSKFKVGDKVRITILRDGDGEPLDEESFDDVIRDNDGLEEVLSNNIIGIIISSNITPTSAQYRVRFNDYEHFWSLREDEIELAYTFNETEFIAYCEEK